MEQTVQTKKRKRFYPVQGLKRGEITDQIQLGDKFITFTNENVAYSTTDGFTCIIKRFMTTPEQTVVETATARWFSMLLDMRDMAETSGDGLYYGTEMTNKDVFQACVYVTDTIMEIPCGAFMNDQIAIDTANHFMESVYSLARKLEEASAKKPAPETIDDVKENEKAFNAAIMQEEAARILNTDKENVQP